jgi:TRAP-type mannitol/chloroaromatic compound transport system substrate-binding protein
MLKRRQLLTHTALGATVALGACARESLDSSSSSASSDPLVEWRMTVSWPKAVNIIFSGVDTIARRVGEMTNGRFTIIPYEAGEIVDGLKVLDAVMDGTVECGYTASLYFIDKNSALAFSAGLPFGLTTPQQITWLYQGGGLEILQKMYDDFGVIFIPAGNTGGQMGGWFRRELNTVADLKGLKMRIPGLGAEILKRLGVDVQMLPVDEIVPALLNGDIDAVEWIGPYEDEQLGLHKATSFYYAPGWWEPNSLDSVYVNKTEWEKLPQSYQTILKTAVLEAQVRVWSEYEMRNSEALERLLAGGTKILTYSPEILQTARQTAFALYEERANENETFREIYQQWNDFRRKIQKWHQTNELSYANFTFNSEE